MDGYSLLHHWSELARGRARHSAAAREELVQRLTQYHDACGTPITVVFDGASGPAKPEKPAVSGMEILYTRTGQTADQIIERVTGRLVSYGEVLVVTNDLAERDLVISLGGMAASCENFVRTMESAEAEMKNDLKRHNLQERNRFNRAR